MVDARSTIELVFEGIDNASEVARSVSASLGGMADSGSSITAPFAAATTGILQFEAGVLAAGATVIGFSVAAADSFDTAFREIATLTNQSVEDLGGFRQAILDYASGSTQGLDKVTGAVYAAISAGVQWKDSLAFLSEAEKLSVAGKAELNTTTVALVSTLNAYGASTDQAGKYSDILFQTVKQGQTTLPELASQLSGVTSTAVLGGVSFEELGAAIATLTASGAPTGQAITRINAALSAIIKPSGEAADLAAELGIQFDIQALKTKGLSGVLADVAEKTGGAGDKMAVLFGSTEALNAVNVLAVSSSGKFRDNLDAMRNSAGAVETAFGKMKDATSTLAQAFQVALVNLGTPFLDEFGGIEDALGALATSFGTAIKADAFAPLISVVETNLGAVAKLFEKVAENLPAALAKVNFGPFANQLQKLFDTIADLFNFDGLATEDGLRKAIQTVVDLLTQTTAYSSGALKALGPFVDKLLDVVTAISEIDIGKIATIGEIGGYALAANTAFGLLGATLLGISGAAGALPKLAGVAAAVKTELSLMSGVIGAGGTGGLIAALGAAGLAGAVGLLAFEITKLTGLDKTLNDVLAPDALAGYQGATLGTLAADLAEKLGLLGPAAEESASRMQSLPPEFDAQTKAAAETRKEINGWLDAQEAAAKQTADTKAEIDALTKYYAKLGQSYDAVTGSIAKLTDEQKKANDAYALASNIKIDVSGVKNATDANNELVVSYSQIGGGTVKATGAFKAVGDSASEQAKKVDDATKAANDFKVKMEEIASNERIKTIEASVKLNVAQIEADVERVKATFASIDTTIKSTGDLLGSLFGNLVGTDDPFKSSKIESQIALENERRQKALDIQKQLAEAEIERIQAQTRALDRGDAIIKIDGTGLEPELEAFMWKILKKIRVRANADYSDYLLGIGTT